MKIIIVEDDAGIRDALSLALEIAGHEAKGYADGMSILEGNFSLPDIFLIDKQLSGVDGLDVCRHLKGNDNTKDIPVIMMSASPDAARLAQDACADAFIEKPFKNKALIELLSRHVK